MLVFLRDVCLKHNNCFFIIILNIDLIASMTLYRTNLLRIKEEIIIIDIMTLFNKESVSHLTCFISHSFLIAQKLNSIQYLSWSRMWHVFASQNFLIVLNMNSINVFHDPVIDLYLLLRTFYNALSLNSIKCLSLSTIWPVFAWPIFCIVLNLNSIKYFIIQYLTCFCFS